MGGWIGADSPHLSEQFKSESESANRDDVFYVQNMGKIVPICMTKLGFTHIYRKTRIQNKDSLTRQICRYIGYRLRRKPIF